MNLPPYHISAVRNLGADALTACADNDPRRTNFALYRRNPESLLEWVSDHATRAEAEQAAQFIHHETTTAHTPTGD